MRNPPGTTAVWIAPTATRFSCLCEPCLDLEDGNGLPVLEVVGGANVRGTLALDHDVGIVRCPAGHELVVRRRPASRRSHRSATMRLVAIRGGLGA